MCLRDDNLESKPLHPDDPMDYVLIEKAFYVIRERHLNCTPSLDCMQDAVARFYKDAA